ncbi:MAG: hypothetical protein ACRDD7_01740 [Peptostreptococcaceae bacterium]
MAIIDIKPNLGSTNLTISAGSITNVTKITHDFDADDNASTILKGQVDNNGGSEKYIVELIQADDTNFATNVTTLFTGAPDVDGYYGFAFSAEAAKFYRLNVYRDERV